LSSSSMAGMAAGLQNILNLAAAGRVVTPARDA